MSHINLVAARIGNPKAIISMDQLLREDDVVEILSGAEREILNAKLPDCEAKRISLSEHAVCSLLQWLADYWLHELVRTVVFRKAVREVMARLTGIANSPGAAHHIVRASLVARYLVACSFAGADAKSLTSISAITDHNGELCLPSYRPRPHDAWRRNVTASDRDRFLGDFIRFWSGKAFSGRSPRKHQRRRISVGERLADAGVHLPTRRARQRARRILSETELGADAPPVNKRRQAAHAGLTAYASQLVVDSAPYRVGLEIASRTMRLDPSRQSDSILATSVVAELAIFCGFRVHDCLQVSIGFDQRAPASYNPERECLISHVANGYHRSILGRVPSQDVEIPLPLHTRSALSELSRRGFVKVADAYGQRALDAWIAAASDILSTGRLQPLLRRIHLTWLYTAVHIAQVDPGIIQLLLADTWGPYRAELNYLTINERDLWRCVYKIHDAIGGMLGSPISLPGYQGRVDHWIGKLAPSLGSLADSGQLLLQRVVSAPEVAACATWILQCVGRRPTGDFPHPSLYLLDFNGSTFALLGDKNLTGVRRLRIVPVSPSIKDAATAARKV